MLESGDKFGSRHPPKALIVAGRGNCYTTAPGTAFGLFVERFFHMARRRRIYEGKAKILFEGPEPGTIVQYFKDDATAFNSKKTGQRVSRLKSLSEREVIVKFS